MLVGAKEVVFQDFNLEVLENATQPVVDINSCDRSKCEFLAGSWEQLISNQELYKRFDIVIMSETLYNQDYYPSLCALIQYSLKQNAHCLVGTKTFYYGLGGGYYELQSFLAKNPGY
jgi:hypothetical protein